ncbi:hypothetical protein SNE40_004979 [Patella caerulea]|uniref:Uncharacterized protein n=1 Tax=Patella caerulea TaxID=87958 RepID=A0AAN8K5T8_PATCE
MDKSSSTATKYQSQVAECKHKPKKLAIYEPQTSQCDLPDHESYCGTRTESSCERSGSDNQLVGASSLDKNNTLKRTNDDLLSLDAVPSVPESSSENPRDSLQGYEIVQQVQKEASQSQNEINFKIKKYTDLGLMPLELTYGYKDAVILCSDNDLPEVKKFKKSLETNIVLLGRERPKIALISEIEVIQGDKFRALDFVLDRFTFVFLFITSSFVTDAWVKYSSDSCLMESITNPKKRWSIVPVFTDKREGAGYEIPMNIHILCGVPYWSSDDFGIESIRMLFENNISVRKEKELVEKGKQSEWVFKFEEEQLKARARIEELKQKKASLGQGLSMPNNAPTLNSKGAPHYQHSKSFAGLNSTDQGTEVSTQSTCYRPAAEHTEPVSGKLGDLSLKQKSTLVCNPASSKDGQLPVESTTYFSSSVDYESFAVVEEKDENANNDEVTEDGPTTSGAGVAGPSKIEENKVLQYVQEIHHHHEVKTYHVKADNVQIGGRNKLVMKDRDRENQQYSEETDEEEDDRKEYEFEGREYKNHPLETEDEITNVKSLNDPDDSDS